MKREQRERHNLAKKKSSSMNELLCACVFIPVLRLSGHAPIGAIQLFTRVLRVLPICTYIYGQPFVGLWTLASAVSEKANDCDFILLLS